MTTRSSAKTWLAKNLPAEAACPMRSSKYYKESELWFLTFPSEFLIGSAPGHLIVMLQDESSPQAFHVLKIPFAFLRENRSRFDIRGGDDKFDLHISAKKSKWMVDLRSEGVDFSAFLAQSTTHRSVHSK
jgi:hypothetical protein